MTAAQVKEWSSVVKKVKRAHLDDSHHSPFLSLVSSLFRSLFPMTFLRHALDRATEEINVALYIE